MIIRCEKCKKKLLERLPNGIWSFKFGKRNGEAPVVDMEIHGSIKFVCTRRTCRHVNFLQYFPDMKSDIGEQGKEND